MSMNPCATGFTVRRIGGPVDPNDPLGPAAIRMSGWDRSKREMWMALNGAEVTFVTPEPTPVEKDHVLDAFIEPGPWNPLGNPERLHDGRLIPKFALAHEFTPTFLKQKSTRKRRKNGNHAKPSTK